MFLIILIIIGLFHPTSALATDPILSATLSTSSVKIGETFSVYFNVYDLNIYTSYNAKVYGNDSNYDFQTLNEGNWLSFNSPWGSFPVYTTGIGTSLNGSIISRVNPDKPPGNYNANLKLCEIAATQNCLVLSTPLTLTVLAAPTSAPASMSPIPTSPTTTPAPTSAPSNTPDATLNINSSPDTLKIGQNYTVTFTIDNAVIGHDYALKAFGGINDNFGFENQSDSDWLSYNSAWASFTKYAALTSTISTSISIRVESGESTGQAQLKFKLKDITADKDYSETSARMVTILAADPISTPTKTPTTTPKASVTPSIIPSPEPTDSLDSSLLDGLVVEPTDRPGLVAGLSTIDDVIITPTPTPKKSSSNLDFLPFVFIGLGGVLLCVPFIVAKIRKP